MIELAPTAVSLDLDTSHSKIVWTGKKVTGSHYGSILFSYGWLVFEGEKLISGGFEANMNSITCYDLSEEWATKLVEHLKSDDFFSVEKYPAAKFLITEAEKKSREDYLIKGDMTIKGITHPLEFSAKVITEKGKVVATAKVTIDRTKFNVRYGSGTFFSNLGDKMIYDHFELAIQLSTKAS